MALESLRSDGCCSANGTGEVACLLDHSVRVESFSLHAVATEAVVTGAVVTGAVVTRTASVYRLSGPSKLRSPRPPPVEGPRPFLRNELPENEEWPSERWVFQDARQTEAHRGVWTCLCFQVDRASGSAVLRWQFAACAANSRREGARLRSTTCGMAGSCECATTLLTDAAD